MDVNLGVVFHCRRSMVFQNRLRVVYMSDFSIIILSFTFGTPFLFLMSSTQVFSVAILGMIVFGLARGFNDSNLMPVLCQIIDGRYIATGYGFLNFISTIILWVNGFMPEVP